jgi:hypothetical protein
VAEENHEKLKSAEKTARQKFEPLRGNDEMLYGRFLINQM